MAPYELTPHDKQTCGVCLMPNLVNLQRPGSCFHIFHETCLDSYVRSIRNGCVPEMISPGGTKSRPHSGRVYVVQMGKPKCPVCRTPFRHINHWDDQLNEELQKIWDGPKRLLNETGRKLLAIPEDVKVKLTRPLLLQTNFNKSAEVEPQILTTSYLVYSQSSEFLNIQNLTDLTPDPIPLDDKADLFIAISSSIHSTPDPLAIKEECVSVADRPNAFKCHICFRVFKSTGEKSNHMQTHQPKKKCEYCPKLFSRASNRDRHEKVCRRRPSPNIISSSQVWISKCYHFKP